MESSVCKSVTLCERMSISLVSLSADTQSRINAILFVICFLFNNAIILILPFYNVYFSYNAIMKSVLIQKYFNIKIMIQHHVLRCSYSYNAIQKGVLMH